MKKMFFEVYEDNLRYIQNNLLQYHLEFEQLKGAAKSDFFNGLLTKKEYQRISAYRINEYYPDLKDSSKKSPYSLNKMKVDLINKYAKLNSEGEILLDSLKPEFGENLQRLKSIFESIRLFYFYDNLDIDDLKKVFKDVVLDYYNKLIEQLSTAMDIKAPEATIDGKKISAEMFVTTMRSFQLHKETAIDRIEGSTKEELMQFIEKFYDLNYKYYEWFKVRDLQGKAKDVTLFAQHQDRLSCIAQKRADLKLKQQNYQAANRELSETYDKYQSFMMLTTGVIKGSKKSFLAKFRLGNKNNMAELAEVFLELVNYPGAEDYIKGLDQYNETNLFSIYMANKYPLVNYVDKDDFRREFIDNLNNYFVEKIKKMQLGIKGMEEIIASQYKELDSDVDIACEEASYGVSIASSLNVPPIDAGLSNDEEIMIFGDMKEYFAGPYKKDVATIELRCTDELRSGKTSTK